MKILFKTIQYGAGMFLEFDMKFANDETGNANLDGTEAKIIFENGINDHFQEGSVYISIVIARNFMKIKKIIGHFNVVSVTHVYSNLAHYQVESFLGATVQWLNENIGIKADIPIYIRNTQERRFDVEYPAGIPFSLQK